MEATTVRLGVIGCGRWGINHVKTASAMLGQGLVCVADANPSMESVVRGIAPSARFTTDPDELISDPEVNAVVVATPAETHFPIARTCLEHGKHVLVEKPITLRSIEARELVHLAHMNDLRLMVGHILLYHPAVIALKQLICDDKIGRLQYIYSNRLNLGAVRSEENILWSFAPHDISIIQYFTETKPLSVDAFGARYLQPGIEDTTITILKYPNNVHAHIFVSWLHPFKEHRVMVNGSEGMLVFEDSAQTADKLKLYHKGFHRTEHGLEKFDGDFESIPIETLQPLTEEHKHFYGCIDAHTTPLTDGVHALEVLEILEHASRRLRND
ncbi:MAG TPA: Gfo/Idh/MocA family oxidoreductase [Bacteroidota bacterium]|nr:Gfo/Idh/MocA family oxidoreductase [Bacteroidota bacterium]